MTGDSGRSPGARGFVEPIETTRTFEHAIDRIVEAIEQTRLRRGDRLPPEGELSRQLGISKPTLRQALRVLERSSLIEVRRGRDGGIFVGADLVPGELIWRYVELEEEDVIAVLKARRVVEGGLTELATANATAEDFAEIERTIRLLERHVGDRPFVMRADAAFHRAVTRAAHNAPLQSAMRLIARDLAPIRDAYRGGEEEDAVTLRVHRRQLDAMVRRDRAALRPILDEHFRMLEVAFAEAIGRKWEELFGVEREPARAARKAKPGKRRTGAA